MQPCSHGLVSHSRVLLLFIKCHSSCGQDYLCVHERVADAFLARMRAQSEACYSADAQASEWFGRVINARAHARVSAIVARIETCRTLSSNAPQRTL